MSYAATTAGVSPIDREDAKLPPAQTWPNDCPSCGQRMNFQINLGEVFRCCPAPECGRVIRAEEAVNPRRPRQEAGR